MSLKVQETSSIMFVLKMALTCNTLRLELLIMTSLM